MEGPTSVFSIVRVGNTSRPRTLRLSVPLSDELGGVLLDSRRKVLSFSKEEAS